MQEDPLPFELRSLEVFLCVCESGTMSAAARTLGITQSAISQSIAELEQKMKTTLFDRQTRPLGLTLGGVVLRQRASILLGDARQIGPLLQEVRKGKLPVIRVGLIDSLARLLLPALPTYLRRLADQVSFVSGLTSSHVEDIFGRRLDIFLGIDEFEELDGLETWPLLDEPYVVITPPGTPQLKAIKDLAGLSQSLGFVRYHHRRKIGAAIERHLRRIGVNLPRTEEFDTPYGVTASVAAGSCFAITTPLCIFEAGGLGERIECQRLPGPGFNRRLSLIARRRELARVPKEVAEFSCRLLQESYLPAIAARIPGIEPLISIGDEIQRRS